MYSFVVYAVMIQHGVILTDHETRHSSPYTGRCRHGVTNDWEVLKDDCMCMVQTESVVERVTNTTGIHDIARRRVFVRASDE